MLQNVRRNLRDQFSNPLFSEKEAVSTEVRNLNEEIQLQNAKAGCAATPPASSSWHQGLKTFLGI